jgi:release factor glutamine methyltransferase
VKIGGMESSAEPGSAGSIPPAGVVAALRGAGCVFAEQEAQLLLAAADGPAELARLVRARVAGTPLEYLVGWVEFDGLRIAVTDGVFVPRQRSRLLVRAAVGHLAGRPEPLVVELCCGCGAIGLAIAAAVPGPTWPRSAPRCTRAICSRRCPAGCAAPSMCSSPTRPTCPPQLSR